MFIAFIIAISLVYLYSGIRWNQPLPMYFELAAHPTYVVTGLLGAWLGLRTLRDRILASAPSPANLSRLRAAGIAARFAAVAVAPFVGMLDAASVCSRGAAAVRVATAGLTPPLKADASPAVDEAAGIVPFLQQEIAIRDDGRFRGSVANLIGVPGGPVMARCGVPEEAPFNKEHILFLDQYLRQFHPSLTMSGLWDLRIPTLEDNNHLVTPPFHFLVSRALSRPQDYHSRNWAVVTLARPGLMAALGVRFLLTDRVQSDPLLALRTQQVKDGATALVYELREPNLGDYSPTETVVSTDAATTLALMKDEHFAFRNAAIVDTPISEHLTRATRSEMDYEQGGVRVRAETRRSGAAGAARAVFQFTPPGGNRAQLQASPRPLPARQPVGDGPVVRRADRREIRPRFRPAAGRGRPAPRHRRLPAAGHPRDRRNPLSALLSAAGTQGLEN